MEEDVDLSHFPVEVVRVGSRYTCVIPKLFLSASDDELEEAYARICAKRKELLNDAQSAGVLDRFRAQAPDTRYERSSESISGLGSFSIRVSIISLAAALLFVLAGAVISTTSGKVADVFALRLEAMSPFTKDWDKRMSQVEDWLNQAASPRNQLSPAREAKMRENLRILVARVRPYIDELAPLADRKPSAHETSNTPAGSPSK